MIAELERDELLDWIALWQVDCWGPERDDLRAAATSFWNRGGSFDEIKIQFPYVAEESEEDIIAMLERDAKEREIDGAGT